MNTKIIKYKKLIICVMFILGIAFYFTIKHFTGNHADASEIHTVQSGLSYIKQEQVIDKEAVIRSLSLAQQLVGLDGSVSKTYEYSDSIFKGSGWLKDAIGQRSIEMTVNAYFKMGINLSDIGVDDIRVYGQTLQIKLPEPSIVSLDAPFNEITFNEKTGMVRSSLTMEDKQRLYGEIRALLEQNIMDDESVKSEASESVQTALKGLLEKIPNCNQIVFSKKLN